MPRFLYGDSSPSSLEHNVLATVEVFVRNACRMLVLHQRAADARQRFELSVRSLVDANSGLGNFHRELLKVLSESVGDGADPAVRRYAEELSRFAAQYVDRVRASTDAATAAEESSLAGQLSSVRDELAEALSDFLLEARLETVTWRATMRLEQGRCELSGVFTMPDDIVASYVLSTAQRPEWNSPRRVSDFASDIQVQVGLKKAFLRRSLSPEMATLDDYIVSEFDVGEKRAEITLRRKADGPDAVRITLARDEGRVRAVVVRIGDEGPESGPLESGDEDSQRLERLWQLIRMNLVEKPLRKDRVLSVLLRDKDVVQNGLERRFVERLVGHFAPTLLAIGEHSPNPDEFSLKIEDDEGRREEVYLSKRSLLEDIDKLPPDLATVFAPFELRGEPVTKELPQLLDEGTADE